MRDHGASLVAVSSVMGTVGQPAASVYSASKGALNLAVKSLALEFARQKIRVNSVAPGLVETSMAAEVKEKISGEDYQRIEELHPLGIGKTEDVASAIAFLLSDMSKWITGTTLIVDGGYTSQ